MKRCAILFLPALAACGQATEQSAAPEAREAAQSPPRAGAPGTAAEIAVALPRIAYSYSYAFRLPAPAVTRVQDSHVALCDRLGPARCRIVDLRRGAGSGDFVQGSLKLQVAAPIARAFGARLIAAASGEGGETIDEAIEAEDLSKQMIDTEARIRTKQALADRLNVLLATRSGNIQQAVEAERAVNAAQEELEQARAWLVEMRGRVAMSTMDVRYQSGSPLSGGFSEPVRDAFAEVAALTGKSIGMIVVLLAAVLPWAALLLAGLWGVRRYRRWRDTGRRADEPTPADPGPPTPGAEA